MQVSLWNSAGSNFGKSANLVSTQHLLLHLMPNCLSTGGSKDPFSWSNAFAKQQTIEIFGSPPRVNILGRIPHSRSSNPQLQRGARTAILASGWIPVTSGSIHICTLLPSE